MLTIDFLLFIVGQEQLNIVRTPEIPPVRQVLRLAAGNAVALRTQNVHFGASIQQILDIVGA
jgi:hypothetical protein